MLSAAILLASGARAGEPDRAALFAWTGWYFGLNAGHASSSADFGIDPKGAWSGFPAAIALLKDATDSAVEARSFTGGVQLGFNQRTGALVWGIEADFNGVAGDGADRTGGPVPTTGVTGFSQHAELAWMATIRGRLGLAADRALIYATGGVAFGEWDVGMAITAGGGGTAIFHDSSVHTGWVVGGGVEYALTRALSLKLEYLYSDFGDVSGASSFPLATAYSQDHAVDLTSQVVRFGLNAKF